MKPFKIKKFIILCILVIIISSDFIHSIRIKKLEKYADKINTSENISNKSISEMSANINSPLVGNNNSLNGEPNFENVQFVKEISATSKAALEIQNSGE